MIKINDGNQNKPIVKRTEEILLSFDEESAKKGFTPIMLMSILSLVIIIYTYLDYKKKSRNKILDGFIFSITGFVGIMLLLLWFATDHSATANNFNILWAFAPNLLFLFVMNKNARLSYFYVFTLLMLLDIMVLLWVFKVQVFHYSLIALLVGLYVRYIYLWFYFRGIHANIAESKNL